MFFVEVETEIPVFGLGEDSMDPLYILGGQLCIAALKETLEVRLWHHGE